MHETRRVPRLPPVYLLGPAFVAAIAYVDPGNVAANVSAGSQFGFLLLWVIVVANLMASLVQYLSAKLGLVTGLSLPEAVAQRARRSTRLAYWTQAELVAMATDVAEVVGGAIALYLLFGLPLLWGGIITGAVSLVLLAVQNRRGQRAFERVIVGLLAVIAIGFLSSLFVDPPGASEVAAGLLPRFDGAESVLLATAMLGATVMPHNLYLHSSIVQTRKYEQSAGGKHEAIKFATIDSTIALMLALFINASILILAAAAPRPQHRQLLRHDRGVHRPAVAALHLLGEPHVRRKVHHAAAVAHRFHHHFRQAVIALRADHHVHKGGAAQNFPALRLGDAAGDCDQRRSAILAAQAADVRVNLFRRLFADVASVEHHQVGLFSFRGRRNALFGEKLGHAFAVIDVHLAAEALDAIGPGRRGRAHGEGPISQFRANLKRYRLRAVSSSSRPVAAIVLRLVRASPVSGSRKWTVRRTGRPRARMRRKLSSPCSSPTQATSAASGP